MKHQAFLVLWLCLFACKNESSSRSPGSAPANALVSDAAKQSTKPSNPTLTKSPTGTLTTTHSSTTSTLGTASPTIPVAPTNSVTTASSSPNAKQISKMVLLGDSIGVGLFSDTVLGPMLPDDSPVHDFASSMMGGSALEDALKETNDTYRDNYPSAFVGKLTLPACFSLACQFHLTADNASNLAISGSHISDVINTQVPALDTNADLVVVEIGANDFCTTDYNEATFLASYKQILDALSATPKQPMVLVIPIPNIPSVFQAAPAATKTIVYDIGFAQLPLSCGDFRDGKFRIIAVDPFCPRLAVPTPNSASQWTSLNTNLEKLVATYKPERFVFAKNMTTWVATQADLAWDCFHPNLSAHKSMAKMMWDSIGSLPH